MQPLEFSGRLRSIGVATGTLLVSQWQARGLWSDKLTTAAALMAVGQARAATLADSYVVASLGGADATIVPDAFAGVASDGRPLNSLLVGAAIAANTAKGDPDDAARAWLEMAAATQVADVGRVAMRAGMAVRDAGGVRIASTPCCGRCAVLHGRHYSWRAGFQRHPRCDCGYQLVTGSDWEAPDEIPLDQIRGLSQADRKAIELGADRSRVINAHRGMYTTEIYGQRVKATFDSTARRSSAFPARDNPNTVRLRPESILQHATDHEDAIRLLTKYGYIR